jgi:hypothetical protein
MAGERNDVPREVVLKRALQLATEAMDLLDAHGSDPRAAAHLALAQQQLRKSLASYAMPARSMTGRAEGITCKSLAPSTASS